VVADRETRRLSFGSVATDYDRYRPPPPPQALDWLIPPGAQAILDLAAGTGVVTRELIGRAARVVAVEPDERMRAVLAASSPEAEVLAGRGEDIPLPAASVDAVVSSAVLHFARDQAHFDAMVQEMWRVLRPGGLFFARLATTIGIEGRVVRLENGRWRLPDGSERFLMDEERLMRRTAALGGVLADPLKTTNVQNLRAMTTWCVHRPG